MAELLLQRTTAVAVANFLPVFLERYPSWASLRRSSLAKLESALKPVGLWSRRARTLKDLALALRARGDRFPVTREELEQLPGIGQYVASAVLLVVHGTAAPLLDSSMARVLERVFGERELADIRYDRYLQELAHALVDGPSSPELNWAVLDLAAVVCRIKDPRCPQCPLVARCKYANVAVKRPDG